MAVLVCLFCLLDRDEIAVKTVKYLSIAFAHTSKLVQSKKEQDHNTYTAWAKRNLKFSNLKIKVFYINVFYLKEKKNCNKAHCKMVFYLSNRLPIICHIDTLIIKDWFTIGKFAKNFI